MFRMVLPPIIRSAYNCIYIIWYLSHRYCYLPLSWKSGNWFECAVGGVAAVAVTVWQIPDAVDTVVCAPDDGWKYHSKHVEQFPDINKLCNVASCWIYEYIGILLGAHPILHISRIRVNPKIYLVADYQIPEPWEKWNYRIHFILITVSAQLGYRVIIKLLQEALHYRQSASHEGISSVKLVVLTISTIMTTN